MPRWLARAYCLATLGHDALYDTARRVNVAGWWYYPCRKCGTLLPGSVWAAVDAPTDERDA